MPVAPLAARATDTSKPTGLQNGSTNPAIIVRFINHLHHLESALTCNTGYSHCYCSHLHIHSHLRLYRKTKTSKLLYQPSQAFKMAVLDWQGWTLSPFQEKIGCQEYTGSRDFLCRDQSINERIYHALPSRNSSKRRRQSQHIGP